MTEVQLRPTRFVSQLEAKEGGNVDLKARLIWATPIIAAIASILDASFIAHWITSEIPGLFFTVLAAISGFAVAVTSSEKT